MTGQELKSRVLDKRERVLCHNCKYRYCPTYDCNIVDKAKVLTYKQWENIAKEASEDDLCDVPYEIMKRRIKHDQTGKNKKGSGNHQ